MSARLHEDLDRKQIAEVPAPMVAPTLSEWLKACIEDRTDLALSSRLHYRVAGRDLLRFFGGKTRIDHITPAGAQEFRTWMSTARKLSDVTVNMHCSRAKQFFGAAVSHEILTENPFEVIHCSNVTNRERLYFVTREEAETVLKFLPSAEWRLLFALCRYGGLRCPSEVLRLRWKDIDWVRKRFTVHGPKLERHLPGGPRQIPLFPELLPYLRAVYREANADAEYVITPTGCTTKNPANYLRYTVARAGLKPWPRITQNLRSTRETELAEDYPLHVVAAWMGHTRRIAIRHYLQVTESHYEKAAADTRPSPSEPKAPPTLPEDLADAWADLPEHVKTAILTLASTASHPGC